MVWVFNLLGKGIISVRHMYVLTSHNTNDFKLLEGQGKG